MIIQHSRTQLLTQSFNCVPRQGGRELLSNQDALEIANVARGKKKKKRPLFCPRNSLKRASFYIPCDDSESCSPQTPFAMFWLNFNCDEGVIIIASITSFMNNVTV